MESEKNGIADLIYKAEIETDVEEKKYGYQGVVVGWIGRLGLTYIYYWYYV